MDSLFAHPDAKNKVSREFVLAAKRKPAPRWLYDVTTLGAGKNHEGKIRLGVANVCD